MNSIYKQLIDRFGDNQVIVAIEELSELQKELTKYLRGQTSYKNILEELADVEIVLAQMKLFFGFSQKEIEEVKHLKLKRTEERLLTSDNYK